MLEPMVKSDEDTAIAKDLLHLEQKVMPKDLRDIKLTKPLQLSLFELLTETDILSDDGSRRLKRGGNYSQTFEVIDFMPRWKFGRQSELRKSYNGLLPAIVRDFKCRGVSYQLTLTPAVVIEEGDSIAYYPSTSEDLLETVLRKMYLDGGAQFFDNQPGLTFTINQIRKEMSLQGHTRSHSEIVRSLRILANSGINCVNKETDADLSFKVIDTLYLSKKNGVDTPCYLIFSKIYGEAIEGLYFRRVNYRQVVRYKLDFARLLHRRISHHFTQAREDLEWSAYLSNLLSDFGLEYATLAKAFADFKKAATILQKSNVIKAFDFEPILSSKGYGKYEDYFLKITPTKSFSFEMANSNKIAKAIAEYSSEKFIADSLVETSKSVKKSPKSKRKFDDILPSSLNKKSTKNK